MVQFNTLIKQFQDHGDKTGWTYIEVRSKHAEQIFPGNKRSFRVKGLLDDFPIKGVALMPAGEGNFILPLNATMRKGTGKRRGAKIKVQLERDAAEPKINAELLECLKDEPKALEKFNSYTPSHKLYFSNWINSAKTEPTRITRIAQSVEALRLGHDFGQMIRSLKARRDDGRH